MVDRYVAIATVCCADFRPLESDGRFAETRGPGYEAMPDFLRQALHGEATRGPGNEPNWGIGWFDIELLPPKQ